MKVLHLIDSAGLYGAEVMLLHLVAEQKKQGLQPIIGSIGEKGIKDKALETEAKRRGFQVENFRMTPGPNYLGALSILKFAWREGVDILHSHGYKANILLGLISRRIRKIPMITTVHGYTSTGNGITRMRLYEWLDSKALRFMDAVVFVSHAMTRDPRFKHLNASKVHVIHNGIPISDDSFNNSPNQRFDNSTTQPLNHSTTQLFNHSPNQQFDNLTNSQSDHSTNRLLDYSTNQPIDQSLIDFCRPAFTLGSIGRLSPEKGYMYLIDALKIIRDKGYDVRLVIIGEGGERPALEKQVKDLALEDCVLLPGYKKNASAYLPCFNVFVLPSLTEGLPMTILEAMRARCP